MLSEPIISFVYRAAWLHFACMLSNPERGLRAEVTQFNSSQCWLNPMISFIEEQLESWEEKSVSKAWHLCMCTLERHIFISQTSVLMCIWLVGCYWPVSKENKKCHLHLLHVPHVQFRQYLILCNWNDVFVLNIANLLIIYTLNSSAGTVTASMLLFYIYSLDTSLTYFLSWVF